jgi:mono/diheme cytochrome c family protein
MGDLSSYHREPCSHEVLVCFAQPRAFRFESEVIFSVSFSVVRSEAAAGRTHLIHPQKKTQNGCQFNLLPLPGGNQLASAVAAVAVPLTPLALRGQTIFQHNSCETCHGIGGLHGTVAGPGLAGTASILPTSVLEDILRHHSIQMQKGGMPLTNMNPPDMKANRRLHSRHACIDWSIRCGLGNKVVKRASRNTILYRAAD